MNSIRKLSKPIRIGFYLAAVAGTIVGLAYIALLPFLGMSDDGQTPAAPPKPQPYRVTLKLRGGYIVRVRPTGLNGDNLYDDEILVFIKEKMIGKIDLAEVLQEWLKHEAMWGDHAEANQARYQHGNQDNLAGVVSRLASKGKNINVTIEWHLRGASAHDLEAVQLAQLMLHPAPQLRFIKFVNHTAH